MRELSIFFDESGDIGISSDYYIISLVFHEQDSDISPNIDKYLYALSNKSLKDIPFHFTPVIRGHQPFSDMTIGERKQLFAAFRTFAEKMPFRYHSFVYQKKQFADAKSLENKMERELRAFLSEHLMYFQQFNHVKIYYDNGQRIVTEVIHQAIESVISNNAIMYKDASPTTYRLFQIADYVCGLELTAVRYEQHKQGPTEKTFFGEKNSFNKNYLKKLRKKRM